MRAKRQPGSTSSNFRGNLHNGMSPSPVATLCRPRATHQKPFLRDWTGAHFGRIIIQANDLRRFPE